MLLLVADVQAAAVMKMNEPDFSLPPGQFWAARY
jgi:hypothetical protein